MVGLVVLCYADICSVASINLFQARSRPKRMQKLVPIYFLMNFTAFYGFAYSWASPLQPAASFSMVGTTWVKSMCPSYLKAERTMVQELFPQVFPKPFNAKAAAWMPS